MRHLISFLVVGAVILSLWGCAKPALDAGAPAGGTPPAGTAATGGEKITLTVWDWHASDPSKPIGQWLARIDEEFQKANPSIKINHVGQSHDEYYEIFKAAAAAASPERGPDVVMLHQGARVIDQSPNLTPLDEFVTPEFRKKLVGWELTCEGYEADGKPWAVPIAVQGLVWYYNRKLLAEVGVDPATCQSWEGFLAACAALKKAGKAGIAVGEKEGYWADWFVNTAYLQTFAEGDRERLTSGEMKWTDPKVTEVLSRLKELNDKGCFQKGAMSARLFTDAAEVFERGDAGFFLGLISDVTHWKAFGEMIGAENLGVMTCPVFKPGPNADKFPTGGAFAYAVTKWTPHAKEAFQYISFVASDEHADAFLSEVGSFPANQGYDRKLVTDATAKTLADWLAAGRGGRQMTEAVATEVGEALRRECQRILSGQTDVAGAAAAVEKVAAAAHARKPKP